MYKVFCDDQLLYLPGDQELVIFNTKLELADNKSGSFEFDIPAVNPMYDRMKKLTSVIRVEKDGDSIFYGRILSMEKNFYNTRTVVCEGELAYLLDSIQEPKVTVLLSPRAISIQRFSRASPLHLLCQIVPVV